VFDLGWRPADVEALTPPEMLYWIERAVAHARKRKSRNRK
jgi:hypothetical protein